MTLQGVVLERFSSGPIKDQISHKRYSYIKKFGFWSKDIECFNIFWKINQRKCSQNFLVPLPYESQKQPPRRFFKLSVLFSRRVHLFVEQTCFFPGDANFSRNPFLVLEHTNFPGASIFSSNRYHLFSRKPYLVLQHIFFSRRPLMPRTDWHFPNRYFSIRSRWLLSESHEIHFNTFYFVFLVLINGAFL